METNPSTSKNSYVPHTSPITIKSVGRRNISQETLNIDEVIRFLNDEYKKAKANPRRLDPLWLGKSKHNFASTYEKAAEGESCLESLSLYTQSLSFAEDDSRELMRAYIKRASLFLKGLLLYDQYEADMQRAIILYEKYSGNLKKNLSQFYRRSDYVRPDERPVLRLRSTNELPERIAEIIKEDRATALADAEDREREWRDMCKLDNRCIPNASSKVRLGYDERKWGRFVEATENLKAGEIIAVQKFFTVYLRPGLEFVRCSLCIALCVALIPCPTCNVMMYCSEKCRDYAYNSYHRLECRIMKLFFRPVDVDGTGFRVVRQLLIGTDQGLQLAKLMETMTVRDIMKTDFLPSEIFKDEYVTALRLHESYARDQVIEFVPFVAQMIEILEHVGFFTTADPEYQDDGSMTKAQIFTAFLLLNHIVGMNEYFFNIEMIRKNWEPRDNEPAPDEDCTVADGFCTLFPVFNHSCDPNVFIMPRNWQAAFITRRPITKGQEITVSYALVGEKRDFNCQCDACVNDLWYYTPDNLQDILQFCSHYLTNIPEIARSQLRTLLWPISNLKTAMFLPPNEILRIVLDVCEWFYTNFEQPNVYHFKIQALVSLFMQIFYGPFNEHVPRGALIEDGYHSVLLKIMDDLGMDLA